MQNRVLYTLLFSLSLLLSLSSCLEEEERIERFQPNTPVGATRSGTPPPPPPPFSSYRSTLESIYHTAEQTFISAEELLGLQLSLNHIYFLADDGTFYENSMRACYLILEELSQDCSGTCAARLDEETTTLPLASHLVGGVKGHDFPRLRIVLDENREGSGSLLSFLRRSIFPVLEGADWIVSRSGDRYYLHSNEPSSFDNTVFTKRYIELVAL